MPPALSLLRPKQYVKNLLVFAGLLFGGQMTNSDAIVKSIWAFVCLCLISSSVYVLNDARDVEKDRNHPRKKLRPLASGKVTMPTAIALGLTCLLAGVAIAVALGPGVTTCIALYLACQLAYNFGLKNVAIADVFIISFGFVLRAAVGAAAIPVVISGWLLFCTGTLALLLGFSKRRHEFVLQGDERERSRTSLGQYSLQTLDALVIICAASSITFYGLYAVQSKTAQAHPGLMVTSIFVLYGICRYVFLVFSSNEGGEPETILFSDRHLIFSIVAFVLAALAAMQGYQIPILDLNSGA